MREHIIKQGQSTDSRHRNILQLHLWDMGRDQTADINEGTVQHRTRCPPFPIMSVFFLPSRFFLSFESTVVEVPPISMASAS